jgi:hypothetical protein
MSLAAHEQQETAARQEILQAEENAWETEVLGTYRKVAAEYNRRIEEQYKPMFDALLQQVSGAYAKGAPQ